MPTLPSSEHLSLQTAEPTRDQLNDATVAELAQVAAAWLADSGDRDAARRAALNHLICA